MAVQIAMADEGIQPNLQVVAQYGQVVVEADRYEDAINALREAGSQYPDANWVIWAVVTHSYDTWTARGTAALLEPVPGWAGAGL